MLPGISDSPHLRPQELRMACDAGADWLRGMIEYAASPHHDAPQAEALVVYASTHGHTAKIAAQLADAMRGEDVAVDVRDVAHAGDVELGRYDLVVVGGSLHKEGHQKALVRWVTEHCDALAGAPSLFFSVSLTAADDSDESLVATQRCIDEFCAKTGWNPGRTQAIAGALQYREYDVFTRQFMRLIMKRMGHPTDASQNYDYTDWVAVDRLGHELTTEVVATTGAGTFG